jgi:uncharacterized protein involved in oxidation of intracellular sulfur
LETITFILQGSPYGDEKIWNGLRLAKALTTGAIGMKVNIFLLGDGVVAAKKGQKPPEGFYNLEKMLKEMMDQGSAVIACRTCVAARGLTEADLIDGVKIGTTVGDLARWVKESQKVLSI